MIPLILDILTAIYAVSAALLALYTFGSCILLALSLLPNRAPEAQSLLLVNSCAPKPALAGLSSLAFEPLTAVEFPAIAVQLPIYNEPMVVERLIDAAARLDYPHDKLIIQVLDDSTDETVALAAARVAHWRAAGIDIAHVRRDGRTDYKAGALKYGMACLEDRAEFAAIFDADFIPPPDFLRRVVPRLAAAPRVGAIQTRWGHLNPDASALTRAQSLALDGHFGVEQIGRARGGLLTNFSGSGGVWRLEAIRAAGGWSAATLTEDLDLSYRAQLCGWQIVYRPDLVVLGEIPVDLAAYKTQQARWARGNTRCLMQIAPLLWRTPGLTLMQRAMGMLHLCQYLTAPLMIALLLLTPPLLLTGSLKTVSALSGLSAFGIGTILMPLIGAWRVRPAGDVRTLWHWIARIALGFPALIALGTGMAWNNAVAVVNELTGRRIAFQRTPKTGNKKNVIVDDAAQRREKEFTTKAQRHAGRSRFRSLRYAASAALKRYSASDMNLPNLIAEMMLAGYALWGLGAALQYARGFAPYMTVYVIGFMVVVVWQIRDALRKRVPADQTLA
ncbi:MAG: glycosyltransferase [Chloroflexota bacterium]|nr:glycosyltransferase [Chloroflexota bacterium]